MKRSIYDISLESSFCKILIGFGAVLSRLILWKNPSGIFFFFPYWHVGGAEKVHADIVQCIQESRPWVFFTHRSFDDKFKDLFLGAGKLFDIWAILKYTLPLSIGILSGFINRHCDAVVFGCNSRFFYKMLPYLNVQVRRIDLMHAFGGGSEDFSLHAVPSLDVRVVINKKTEDDFREQYRLNGIDPKCLDRIEVIENGVAVPECRPGKQYSGRLKVVYVGRGSEEKRVHLIARAATICSAKGIGVDFVLVGDVVHAVNQQDRAACAFPGEISDPAELEKIYDSAHLLLLTSSREGFPMVIMEAMAHGVVPVCTDVGGISVHVKDGVNGVLIGESSEELIAEQVAAIVGGLAADVQTLERLSCTAYDYARDNFSSAKFCAAYRRLFFPQTFSR